MMRGATATPAPIALGCAARRTGRTFGPLRTLRTLRALGAFRTLRAFGTLRAFRPFSDLL